VRIVCGPAGNNHFGMSEPKILQCSSCGQKTRVRGDASGVPHCPKCGQALPWVVETGASNFEAVVEKSPVPVLIDFWAPWCGPCRMVAPALEKLSGELAGRLKVAKINTDNEPAQGERFGVRGIPTLVLMQDGRERDRVTGAMNLNALRDWIESRLPALANNPRS
jgi:thioredoxin 2